MAEPQRDLSNIAGGVQGVHCAGVPKMCGETRFLPSEGCLAPLF